MRLRHLLLASSLLTLPVAAFAQPVEGFYLGGAAGADLLQNQIFNRTFPVNKRTYTFDTGFAANVSLGYGLGNGLRLEIEGDYADNHVRGVKYLFPERAGGHEQQYGGFVNAIYDIDLGLPVTPYVGAGVGYQQVELDGVNSSVTGGIVSPGAAVSRGAFAYQGIAGVSYALDEVVPGLALTAEYRLIGVDDPSGYPRGVTANGDVLHLKIENIFNHEFLIGLRYAFGAPVPPAPTAAAPIPTVQPARNYLVFFDWDRADLTTRARQIVAEAATASTRTQVTRIEVDGYTDRSGSPAYNQGLSVRRGQAVAAELVRDGVRQDQISVVGHGETNPLIPTAAGVREPQNRRVQIVLH